IKVALKFPDGTQLPEMDATNSEAPFNYESKINLSASDLVSQLRGIAKKADIGEPKQPLELGLIARSGDHKDETISKIRLYVVRVDATSLFAKLAQATGQQVSEVRARELAKEALGITRQPTPADE